MYEAVGAGTTFTGTAGINFWLLFEATDRTSGEFVFTIWFKETSGEGQEHLPAPGNPNAVVDEPDPESVFDLTELDCVNGYTIDGLPCTDELTDNDINDPALDSPENNSQEQENNTVDDQTEVDPESPNTDGLNDDGTLPEDSNLNEETEAEEAERIRQELLE
jgi:hypothetical protein